MDSADPTLPIEIGSATFSLEDSGAQIGDGRTAGTESWSAKFSNRTADRPLSCQL